MVTPQTPDYTRAITHTQYKHGNKKVKYGKFKSTLRKVITDNVYVVSKKHANPKTGFPFIDDSFLVDNLAEKVLPIWGGGTFLLLFLGFTFIYVNSNEESLGFIIATLLFLIGFLFFVTYYFTMPHKECIFNRRDGLVTFPGFMWHKNITMPIDKVIFNISGPSVQGGGAFELLIKRPDVLYTKYHCSLGNDCYKDLSFFLWYMDKNRPLPPGEGLDPFRQKDFERRKAAGFPKPLFPADFETPEHTPEQQAERERIGGW